MIAGAIDVVIPVRNGARTIEATIESAASQTRTPHRIIVVDDGSQDRTADIVAALRIPQLELVRTPPRGVSHARNAGVSASRAEFVALLDADDFWHPDKLAQQADQAARRPGAIAVACSTMQIESDGRVAKGTFKRILTGHDVPAPTLQNREYYGGWCSSVMVRARAWRELGGFDETIVYGEDADFAMRLARAGAIASCNDALAYIVRNPDSVTRRPVPRDRLLDDVLAKFAICEKWMRLDPGCAATAASYSARAILSALVRHPRIAVELPDFRNRMLNHVPLLTRTIARSDVALVLNLIQHGLRSGHRLPFALERILRRASSRRKPFGEPRPRRATVAHDLLERAVPLAD